MQYLHGLIKPHADSAILPGSGISQPCVTAHGTPEIDLFILIVEAIEHPCKSLARHLLSDYLNPENVEEIQSATNCNLAKRRAHASEGSAAWQFGFVSGITIKA